MSFGGAVRIDFAATAKCEIRTSFASPQVTKDSSTIEAEIVRGVHGPPVTISAKQAVRAVRIRRVKSLDTQGEGYPRLQHKALIDQSFKPKIHQYFCRTTMGRQTDPVGIKTCPQDD